MTGRSNISSLNLFYTILFLLSAFAVCTVDATACGGIPSCRSCVGTTCTECDPFSGLTPGGASCESCRNQPYCSNCTVSTACTRCNNTKYAPDSSGVCKPCPANCDSCSVSGPTVCDRCSQGYTKSGSVCLECAANCAVCNATGCQACRSGYSLINNVCTKCADNCTSCITNGAGLCDNRRCSAGFGIVTGQVCQACTGLHCRQCDTQGVTSGKCDSCIAPYLPQADNTCQFTCGITDCSDCTANPTFCTTCNAPLGVTPGGQCGPCGTGCARCNKTSLCLTCSMVDSEGPLMNGSSACAPCASDCFSCSVNGAGKCDTCDPGFRLTTTKTCEACTVTGCAKCPDATGTCTECLAGKVLSANTCINCDPHCDFCNVNGAGFCDPDYCQAGYTFDNGTKTCIGAPTTTTPPATTPPVCGSIAHCLDCHVDPNVCIMCDEPLGYGITATGKCDLCSTRTGCFRCHNLTQCTECTNPGTTGPSMDGSGTCLPCSANCGDCTISGAGKCNSCKTGYQLNSTQECASKNNTTAAPPVSQPPTTMPPTATPATTPPICGSIAHCLDCHVDPNVCIMCDEPLGYGITATGKCDLCSKQPGCFRCHNHTRCTECTNPGTTGPSMDGSGTCLPCSANCGDCTTSGAGKCNSCKTGYQLNSTQECASKNNTTVAPSSPPNVTVTAPPPVTAGSIPPGQTGSVPPGTGGPASSVPPATGGPASSVPPGTGGQTGGQTDSVPPGTGEPASSVPPGTGGPASSVPPGTGGPVSSVPPGTGGPASSVPPGTGGPASSVPPGTGGPVSSVPPGTGGPASSVPPVTQGETGGQTGQTVGVMTTVQGTGETTGPIGPATTSPAAVSSGASSSSPPASAASPGMSSPGPASVASSPGPASEASTPEVASTPAPPASTMVPVSTTSGGSGSSSNNNLWFLFIPAGVIALCALLCCCWYCFRGTGGPGFMPMPMGGAVRRTVAPPITRTRVVRAAPEPQFRAAPKAYHRGAITGSPFFGLPR